MSKIATAITGFADEISPDLGEQLALLKKLEFDGLDLRSAFGKNVLELSDAEVDEVCRQTEAAGLTVHAIGSPVNKVPAEPGNLDKELAKLERAIAVAKRCGTRRIRIFSPETKDWTQAKPWVAEQVAMAKDADVVLMHENDGHFFGATPDNSRLLLEEFGGENFRAAFDFANTVLIGFRPMQDWFPWILPHVDTLHIKDAIESERRVVAAGEGDGQIVETLRYLRGEGWHGPLTLEPHLASAGPSGGYSGAEEFERAAFALRRVLAEAQ
jgi:sugar phosphate isomerase/epimerase